MGLRTEIDITKHDLGTTEWGLKIIQHTKGQVILHDYWHEAGSPEDNEKCPLVVNISDIDRLIAGLKAIKQIDGARKK